MTVAAAVIVAAMIDMSAIESPRCFYKEEGFWSVLKITRNISFLVSITYRPITVLVQEFERWNATKWL